MSLLDDLQQTPTQQQVFDQQVVPALQTAKVRVTDWAVGAVVRALAFVVAKFGSQAQAIVATQFLAGYEDYVFGFSTPASGIDVTAWAPILAKQRYGLTQIGGADDPDPRFTKRTITLTNSTGTPYGPLSPGAIIIQFPSGNRYVLDEEKTIAASTTTKARFRSEFMTDSAAGRVYNDASDSTIALVTSQFPGVTATNPAPTFSDTAQAGGGVGTVTPSGTPTPGENFSFVVRIDATGSLAGATVEWSWSLNGVIFTVGIGSSIVDAGSSGVTLTLSDNSGGATAFVKGCLYYINAPGSDVVQVGRDIETPQQLGERCRGLIPMVGYPKDANGLALPVSPTAAAYEAIVRLMNSQIVMVLVETDGTINNRVDIVIAGQGAPVPSSVITSVQNALLSLVGLTDDPKVKQPTVRVINLDGATIYVKAAQLASAQAALQSALQVYFGGTDPKKPLSINGRIEHGHIVSLIENTPGVIRVIDTALRIGHSGGSYAAADLQLPTSATYELPTWSEQVKTVFTWVPQ